MVLPFEEEYRKKYYRLLDEVFDSNFWSDGKMTRAFEEKFQEFTGLYSCAVSSGGAGLLSVLNMWASGGRKLLCRRIRSGQLRRRRKSRRGCCICGLQQGRPLYVLRRYGKQGHS